MRSFPTIYMRGGTSKGIMFLEHDLPGAKAEAAAYARILADCTVDTLTYPA